MNKVGRNDPCWCGSGKKYKKCHLASDGTGTRVPFTNENWIKDASIQERMHLAGAFNGQLMDYLRPKIEPGVSTGTIDDWVREYTYDNGHIPACLGYRGFPKSCCTSLNEVVCHGIPSAKDVLKDGDIINVDLTTIVEGCHGDQSETFLVGDVSSTAKALSQAAANAMVVGIRTVKPQTPLSAIGAAIQDYVHPLGYSVVVDYTGHGIGETFHEEPPIYHFKNSETAQFLMAEGMTFTIEPMINMGAYQVDLDLADKWTVRTKDRQLSAQFEHTLLVTKAGFEILTQTPSQRESGVIVGLATIPENKI